MFRSLLPTVLLLATLTVQMHGVGPVLGARAVEPDPAAFLPPDATIRQTAQGDLDGDGMDDLVSLYALPAYAAGGPQRAGLLVLMGADDGGRPRHLFGEPPADLRGEPLLDAGGSADIVLRDVAGDGRPRILLTVTNRFPNTPERTALWVFGTGDAAGASADLDDMGPGPPPWAGTGFHVEGYLEGERVEVEHHAPGAPSVLRRHTQDPLRGPDAALLISETYRWQGDGFRLAERALSLPPEPANDASSPEAAVISFYAALARGDLAAATDLLGDDLRASRSSTATSGPPDPSIRVEEVRLLDQPLTRRDQEPTEHLVAFRVSQTDPRWTQTRPEETPARTTIGGTWRAQKIGERWLLVEARHHETAPLPDIMAQLPSATSLVQTASGDVRGQGREDIGVLVTGPGRFALVEPYVVFAGPNGLEPAVSVATFVEEGLPGGPFGTIDIADVNGDGKQELTFGGVVGAHSALLWVLQWDGATLTPLFAETSNSPVVGLEDLDGDGVAEILLMQSGYCGSYAASPSMSFAFRWQDGGYRPASWRYPPIHAGVEDRFEQDAASHPTGPRACVQHMLALARAFSGQPSDARTAYRSYASLRQQTAGDERTFVRPIYLGAAYVEADIRAVIAAAESGASPGWTPADRAILFDLLGDALLSRAQSLNYEAEDAVRRNRPEQEQAARRQASAARIAATEAYRAALALDPTDEEARRALGE